MSKIVQFPQGKVGRNLERSKALSLWVSFSFVVMLSMGGVFSLLSSDNKQERQLSSISNYRVDNRAFQEALEEHEDLVVSQPAGLLERFEFGALAGRYRLQMEGGEIQALDLKHGNEPIKLDKARWFFEQYASLFQVDASRVEQVDENTYVFLDELGKSLSKFEIEYEGEKNHGLVKSIKLID